MRESPSRRTMDRSRERTHAHMWCAARAYVTCCVLQGTRGKCAFVLAEGELSVYCDKADKVGERDKCNNKDKDNDKDNDKDQTAESQRVGSLRVIASPASTLTLPPVLTC